MKSVILILASLSLVISSCKKEPEKIVAEEPETPCVCLKENIGTPMASQVPCYGYLTMTNYIDLTREKPLQYVDIAAYFNNVATPGKIGSDIAVIDSVFINQISLPSIKDAFGNHNNYETIFDSWPLQQDWRVFGAQGIPTFSVSAEVKNPVADFSMVPDNMSISQLKSFKINGVANITGAYAFIYSSGQSGGNVSVILKAGSNDICFPNEQLKSIKTGKATIVVVLENLMITPFDNKNFAFSKTLQYSKEIQLNP